MAETYKTFELSLDLKITRSSGRVHKVYAGDNGNKFVITLTDDGTAVDLSACRVAAVFANKSGSAIQTSWGDNVSIAISGTSHNIVTIDLLTGSFSSGQNSCQLQIYSGALFQTLVTTPFFNFNGEKAAVNDDTIVATTEYTILIDIIADVQQLHDNYESDVQSDWDVTDDTLGTYIRNKPVVGTNIQAATQTLTEEPLLADADTIPFYDLTATAHRKTTWANLVTMAIVKIRTALFSTTSGIPKLDGSGNISSTTANTDYAAAAHASRHAVGGADALSGYEKERLTFVDQSVTTSDWATYTASGTEETKIYNKGYTYKKSLSLTGVLSTMRAFANASIDRLDCGAAIYPTIMTYDGGIILYADAEPGSAFVLLSVDCFKAVG